MANSQSFIDVSPNADVASEGIIKIINAMAEAKTSHTNLEKELMLDQIARQRNQQDQQVKLQQEAQIKQQEQQDQISNWGKMFDSGDGGQSSNVQGMANSQTPMQTGSNPAAPIPDIQQPSVGPQFGLPGQGQTPLSGAFPLTGGGQPQQPQPQQTPTPQPQQAQPMASPQISSQYTDLGFKPIGLGELGIARKGQPEPKDYAYVQALNKVKQGTATPGEIQLIKDFNGYNDKSEAMNLKKSAEQDKLETTAINRLSSVRGDTPMAKIEIQRDAAISAYNTLQTAESENRLPTQVEYLDILGQLWKARAGTAPTDQVLKELNVGTMQQKMNKLGQYFTGTPSNANTAQVISSLKGFVKSTGISLDQTHDGYFQTHAIKPKGLDQATWDELKNIHRGNSFQEGIDKYAASLGNGNTSTGKTYGGLTTQQARAQGYTGWDSDNNKWVK